MDRWIELCTPCRVGCSLRKGASFFRKSSRSDYSHQVGHIGDFRYWDFGETTGVEFVQNPVFEFGRLRDRIWNFTLSGLISSWVVYHGNKRNCMYMNRRRKGEEPQKLMDVREELQTDFNVQLVADP